MKLFQINFHLRNGDIAITSLTYLGVDSALPEAGLVLVEHDGDGLQLLVSEGCEELGVAERRGHAVTVVS